MVEVAETLSGVLAEEQEWWLTDDGHRAKRNPNGFAIFSRLVATYVPLTLAAEVGS